MEVRLFGELEVLDGGRPIPLRGAKQRALVALLALARGAPVAADRLIDAVWGEDVRSKPANTLQAQISQLRRVLGPGSVTTSDAGYALAVRAENIDIARFEQLMAEAATRADLGDTAGASGLLREALSLRTGEVLAEFAYADFADSERNRIEELVLAAQEARADAELALGHHDEMVPELEAFCRAHPLRERGWELLIVALYRSGRQAEALRAYAGARDRLVDELGIEPGPALRQLEAKVLAQDPALEAPARHPISLRGNLQHRPSSFVGRDDELAELRSVLECSRLVTLIGPGGVGKTRLALEAAASLQPRYPDGAWMVELASVTDAGAVAPAVAAALEAEQPESQSATAEDRIVDHLRSRSLLVVLDNCEHVIDATAALAERLAGAASGVRILATSREALGVPGEVLFAVGGLSLPAAVALFVDRARSAQARPALDDTTVPMVDDVCRRLDGLPLAIELAAARLRAIPLGALADRLDDRFRLLTGGARTALPRHQTLRAVVDWSYDLLFEDERRLFARLAVFTGGCDLGAAEEVCADDDLPGEEILELLGRLIDKSLVVADLACPTGARYSQLQTLWQYGRERLLDSGEATAIRDRHARWYLDLADQARAGLRGRDAAQWRARVEADLANLRTALEWFVQQDDAESALTLAISVAWLAHIRSDSAEAVRWLGEALALTTPAPPDLHGLAAAWHALHTANVAGATAALDESLAAVHELRRANAPALLAEGLVLLSEIYNRLADFHSALAALAEARPLLVDGQDDWSIAAHDIMAAGNLSALGRLDDAEQRAMAAVARYRDIGERWFIIEGMCLLAGIQEARGGLRESAAAYEALIDTAAAAEISHYQALGLMRLGGIRARLGDHTGAEECFGRGVAISRRPSYTGTALIGRAAALRRLGDLETSRRCLDEAMAIYQSIDSLPGLTSTLIALTWWALAAGDLTAARCYAGRACELAAPTDDPVMTTSAQTARVAVALGESDTPELRAELADLLRRRATTGAGRFARILGGAFGASLDEPDVAALSTSVGVQPT